MTENQPLIYAALSKVMRDVGAIGKGGRNAQQGYNFRGIEDVTNHLHAALVANGVFYVPEVLETEHTYRGEKATHVFMRVKYTFYASDGSSVSAVTAGEAMDYSDKASNKAMSAALKYALVQSLNIPTEKLIDDADETSPVVESDPRATSSRPQPPPPVEQDDEVKQARAMKAREMIAAGPPEGEKPAVFYTRMAVAVRSEGVGECLVPDDNGEPVKLSAYADEKARLGAKGKAS